MAEARDLLLARQLARARIVERLAGLPSRRLEQHLHDVLVGAAVQRALERADGRDDRRVDVGQRRGGHARGEGRGVQLVIGVQGQGDVEGALAIAFGRLPVSV